MIPASQNSKWMVRFALRRDFAWEAGFVDCARTPMSRTRYQQIAAQYRATGRFPRPYEEVRAEAEGYCPPRYLGYLYAIAPGTREGNPAITDGVREHFVPVNGLWTAMDEKVNRLLFLRRDRWPLIKPRPVDDDALEPVHAKYFVLHDTERGEAGLYLWSERSDYLLAPPTLRSGESGP